MRDDRSAGDITPPAVWLPACPTARASIRKPTWPSSRGVLQADAYASFNALFEDGTIREAACWAHARRKFHDLHAARAMPLTNGVVDPEAWLCHVLPHIADHPVNRTYDLFSLELQPASSPLRSRCFRAGRCRHRSHFPSIQDVTGQTFTDAASSTAS